MHTHHLIDTRNNFSIVLQIWWKYYSAVIQVVVRWSAMKFCTWHDSCVVVACINFCRDMTPCNGFTPKPLFQVMRWVKVKCSYTWHTFFQWWMQVWKWANQMEKKLWSRHYFVYKWMDRQTLPGTDRVKPIYPPQLHCRGLKWNTKMTSNIRHTNSQNFYVSRLILHLSLPNPLKPGIKPRMKI